MAKQKEFYINLGMSELMPLQRVSALAWVAYIFFKRNIDFATGEASRGFSLSEMGRLWTRPASQGRAADKVRIERVRTLISELTKAGLVNFDYDTKKFNLPKHDKTPTDKPTEAKTIPQSVPKSVSPSPTIDSNGTTASDKLVSKSVPNKECSSHANTPVVLNQPNKHSLSETHIEGFEEWVKGRLNASKFLYVNNPKSQGYYDHWTRLFNTGNLDKSQFEATLNDLLGNASDVLTPMLLHKAIKDSQVLISPEVSNQRRGFAWL